jgi:putative transcriptional regulator
MPTAKTSAKSSRRSGRSSKARTTARGRALVAAAKEVLAHLRGELDPPLHEYTIEIPDSVDVADIRGALALSQAAFAKKFGLDVTAIQAWEQGRRRPDRTARILLAVIAKEPEAVLRVLGKQITPNSYLQR